MKTSVIFLFFIFFFNSCIPLRIAPTIHDYKTVVGKRFKKGLPKKQLFVFEDPKDAGHFYEYVDTKYQLNDYYVDVEVPFAINGRTYYFSFYEVVIPDKMINLLPAIFDLSLNAAMGNEEIETYTATNENTLLKSGNAYIAIEVFSDSEEDCLSETYPNRTMVLKYLRDLKEEYLTTYHYNEIVFKDQ